MGPHSVKERADLEPERAFQKAQPTSANFPTPNLRGMRRVGALESGFTVSRGDNESALSSDFTEENVQQPALSASRMGSTRIESRRCGWEFNARLDR